MNSTNPNSPRRSRAGLTLVELVTALTVLAITSTAVLALLSAAGNTALYATSTMNGEEQCEFSLRRMAGNIRAAAQLSSPAVGATSSSLTLTTLPDSTLTSYVVTYRLTNGALVEDDVRYNGANNQPNTLATGVSSFSVTRSTTSSPTMVTLTLTLTGTTTVSRTICITCRNL